MSLLVEALQPWVASGLLQVTGRAESTLDELIGPRGAFVPSFDKGTSAWNFDFLDPKKISTVTAAECSRHGVATFQTFFDVADTLTVGDGIPWALVRAYYAAYYAAHAILRALGRSCTYVDARRAARLKDVANIYGITDSITGGLYSTCITKKGSAIDFRCVSGSSGGTHETFWGVFAASLKELEGAILTGVLPLREAQAVFVALTEFREILSRGGTNGCWLSSVRNAVQYRHALDVWFPKAISMPDRRLLKRIAEKWMVSPMQITFDTTVCGDLGLFLNACTFLVSLCRALLKRLDERCTGGKSFLRFGPLKFLAMRNL